MAEFIEPQDIQIKSIRGAEKTYVISMFPAVAGREIVSNYPLTAIPKAGDYKLNEATMLKLMSFVGVYLPNKDILPLSTQALIDNHVPDYEALVKIEIAMMKYNTSFFQEGEISTFFADFAKKVILSISPTLTDSLAQLLATAKQRLTSLKQSTP